MGMKVLRIYIENSVIGGYFDKEFKEYTQKLFCEFKEYTQKLFCEFKNGNKNAKGGR
jgi:hypothetical protein